MTIHESAENYLEAILILKEKNGAVRSIDVAHHLNLSKPSVSVAVKKLRENGFVEMGFDGQLSLTEKGFETAEKVYKRHILIKKFLLGIGVSEENASEEACRIEHVISDETFEKLRIHAENL